MKLRATLPFPLLSFSAAHADVGPDALAGHWRGVFGKGPAQTVIELQFDRNPAGYRGHFWSAVPAGTSLPVSDVELGHSVRFAVPLIGVFEGELHGETWRGPSPERAAAARSGCARSPPDDLRFVN